MGLAEPRKRLKISHDPNNLAWSQSAESYGQKLLTSQGWKPGQGLGARNAKHFNSSLPTKLAVSYKDDTLGLGATLKSQDLIHARTGLDAFQGLLGRLNGKSDVDLEKEVQKNENRKLAMWAQGRWGGVMFVPGGTLVQGDGYKKAEEEQPQNLNLKKASAKQSDGTGLTDRAHHMPEKKRRKEERRRKSEAELGGKAASIESRTLEPKVGMAEVTENVHGVNSGKKKAGSKKKNKKRERSTLCADNDNSVATPGEQVESDPVAPEPPTTSRTIPALPRTGRHVIRGKNIEAKKMAFSDVKMLDQIFMAKG